jgi:hypothetical protein
MFIDQKRRRYWAWRNWLVVSCYRKVDHYPQYNEDLDLEKLQWKVFKFCIGK